MRKVDATARRSQLLSTYGIGGLFPSETSSFMIVGLDYWNEENAQHVSEPRLARSLKVRELKSPPAGGGRDVPVVRFPRKQICPFCRRVGTTAELSGDWNGSKCGKCKEKALLSPFRLIVACNRGHIDDFPIHRWLHKKLPEGPSHEIKMTALGKTSSLDDLVLTCGCGETRSLGKAFGAEAMKGVTQCRGLRPWLGHDHTEACDETPRVLQRGASNVWFPAVRSAISIPPYSEALAKFVNRHWTALEDPAAVNDALLANIAKASNGKFTSDDIVVEIKRRRESDEGADLDEDELRRQEYKALLEGRGERKADRDSDFVSETVEILRPRVPDLITHVRKVTRLREVRALYGFSRLNGVAELGQEGLCKLSGEEKYWLPAIEVIGEGIFMAFDRIKLHDWAQRPFAKRRERTLQTAATRQADEFKRTPPTVDIAKVAIHTLAHLLIDQLSLDAGYPASSLRERLFVDNETAGLLIYTASSDSAGSLGGVASQADPERFAAALDEGLHRLSWCSTDPVCIESTATGTDALNLAACHACALVPETSCELNNTYLDRALLFGTQDEDEQIEGLFSAYVGP